MKKLKEELEEIIRSFSQQEHLTDSIDGDDIGNIVDKIIDTFGLILKENDFDSTVVEKGNHYLVKFTSGNYGEVWYNYHGQWMYQFRNVEDSIEKIYTPKTK